MLKAKANKYGQINAYELESKDATVNLNQSDSSLINSAETLEIKQNGFGIIVCIRG